MDNKLKHRARHSVSAMSSVWPPYQRRKKQNVLPCITSLPPGTRRGYLWRLSERKLLQNSSWKTKYFVLQEDKLYYYASTKGAAGGVIDLTQFTDCLEAPLSDQKKANNVFFLLSEERGYFDKGRYYLSAETLSEMKCWVTELKGAIVKAREAAEGGFKSEADNHYSSIRETPPTSPLSLQQTEARGVKRSLNCPLTGETEEHNLTYSYSSSEEDDLSPPPRLTPRSPRRLAVRPEAHNYQDLVKMVQQVKTQSDSLAHVFRKIEGESLERPEVSREVGLEQSLAQLNIVINRLELQAGDIIKEIQSTHCRVLKELAEAEKVKSDYLDIRQKTESVLLRLEGKSTKSISGDMKQFGDIYSQTFPKLKVSQSGNQKSDILHSILRTSDGSLERKHRQNVRISCEREERDHQQNYDEEDDGELTDWLEQNYCRPAWKLHSDRSAVASPSLRKQSLVNNAVLRHTKEFRSYNQSISTLPPTTI